MLNFLNRLNFILRERDLSMLWLTDPQTKTKSPTLTLVVVGFIIVMIKYLLNNVSLYGINFGSTDAASMGAILGSTLFSHVWGLNNSNQGASSNNANS